MVDHVLDAYWRCHGLDLYLSHLCHNLVLFPATSKVWTLQSGHHPPYHPGRGLYCQPFNINRFQETSDHRTSLLPWSRDLADRGLLWRRQYGGGLPLKKLSCLRFIVHFGIIRSIFVPHHVSFGSIEPNIS